MIGQSFGSLSELNTQVFIKRSLALLLVCLCLFVLYLSVIFGLADRAARDGAREMKSWRDNPVTNESWQFAFSKYEEAFELNPDNPVYHHRLAWLYRVHILEKLSAKAESPAVLAEKAKGLLRTGISLRLSHPYSKADLVLMKSIIGELDEEFYHYLHEAALGGPYEPWILEVITTVGLYWYEQLTPATQMTVDLANFRALVSRNGSPRNIMWGQLKKNAGASAAAWYLLGDFLASEEWDKRDLRLFLSLSDWSWPAWSPATRDRVMHQLRGALTEYSGRNLLKAIQNKEMRAATCAEARHLPGLKAFCPAGD